MCRWIVLYFLSDAALYVVKAATGLKEFDFRIVNFACFTHAFVQSHVDIQNVFVKSLSRRGLFKSWTLTIKVPSQYIVMRWDTWIDEYVSFCDNFQLVSCIINCLQVKDATAILRIYKTFSYQNSDTVQEKLTLKRNSQFIKTFLRTIMENN